MAGLIAMPRDSRTRLCHRLRTHREGKSKRRSMSEWDFIALIDGVHQLGTPMMRSSRPSKGRRTPASCGTFEPPAHHDPVLRVDYQHAVHLHRKKQLSGGALVSAGDTLVGLGPGDSVVTYVSAKRQILINDLTGDATSITLAVSGDDWTPGLVNDRRLTIDTPLGRPPSGVGERRLPVVVSFDIEDSRVQRADLGRLSWMSMGAARLE
ncbi:hypothetical protein QF034_008135 [Streptomyces africanus]|uniref:Uncharacterized protein n=1 Tax=Streptomyces africanus TaxID=231024 RepID=A0ABU0R2L2_9ACTN|nr:hypothetical protein [Streptomyces africanus]MDQ0753904.1 hypothetical protein [Streptomyces africanus]